MVESTSNIVTRKEPRFTVLKVSATRVTVVLDDETDARANIHHGTIYDMSGLGMRLNLGVQLGRGENIKLQISIPEAGIDLFTSGTVRWSQLHDVNSWWIGCSLDEPIPPSILLKLATDQILDRRQDARIKSDLHATMNWELSTEPVGAKIVNYSLGGCCLACDETTHDPCERVLLIMADDWTSDGSQRTGRIPLRVIWSQKKDGVCIFGCSFTSRDGYLILRRFTKEEVGVTSSAPIETGTTQWRWIAIAAIVLFALKTIDLIQDRVDLVQPF